MSYQPLEIKMIEIAGILPSLRAMRLPKGKESDSYRDDETALPVIGDGDKRLAGKLIRAGSDHAKFQRGIIVWLKIKYQVGWGVEHEKYRIGTEDLSTSSTMHGNLKKMSGAALAEKKQADLEELVYTRIQHYSYQALRAMYLARNRHRHPDWQIFCSFVEMLPYFEELILAKKKLKLYSI